MAPVETADDPHIHDYDQQFSHHRAYSFPLNAMPATKNDSRSGGTVTV